MSHLISNDAHIMLAAAVSTRNVVLITDTLMCIRELVEEIQTRFQVSLKAGVGTCMSLSNSQNIQSSSVHDLYNNPNKGPVVSSDGQIARHDSSGASTSSSVQIGVQCPLCDETVSDRASLAAHIKAHSSQLLPGLNCRHCNTSFKELSDLQDHMINGNCGVTGAAFVTPTAPISTNADMETSSTTDIHEVTNPNGTQTGSALYPPGQHSESQPKLLNCPLCNKVFTRSYQLNLHLARHQQLPNYNQAGRTYSCRICSRTFNFTSNRAKHEKICRRGLAKRAQSNLYPTDINSTPLAASITRQQFDCRKCGDTFSSPMFRDRHEEGCEVITLSSPTKTMPNNTGVSQQQTPPAKGSGNSLELPISVNNFKQVVSSATPSKIRDETGKVMSMFCCVICAKLLQTRHSLESHYMSHLGIKPHACRWCGKRFTDSSNWRKHQKNCNEQRHDMMSGLPTMVPPNYSSLNSLNMSSTIADDSFDKRPPSTSSSVSNLSTNLGHAATNMKTEPIDISSETDSVRKSDDAVTKTGPSTDSGTGHEPPVVVDSGLSWFVGGDQ